MTKTEQLRYAAWEQLETSLEEGLRMLSEQNYGLLRDHLTGLIAIARFHKEFVYKEAGPRK